MSGRHGLAPGRLAVVGPGRVGTVLAAALERAGHAVTAAGGGSDGSRGRFARRFPGARTAADPAEAVGGVDLVVVAVPDDALAGVVRALAVADGLSEGQRVVHVAGAHGVGALRLAAAAGARVAACHPAQTVPSPDAGPELLEGVPWAVTCGAADRAWAHDLVRQTGGDPHDVAEDRRVLYHAGLVIGSNAAGAAVSVARHLLAAAAVGDPAAFLRPLAVASVANVLAGGAAALTGPVVRGDTGTLARHLEALDADVPALAAAYRELARVVLAQARPGMPAGRAAAVAAVLEEPDR